MRQNLLILILILSLTTFAQKKKECGYKLDSLVNNFSGKWKFSYSHFVSLKNEKKIRFCKNHFLLIDNSKFSVKRQLDSMAYQNGTIKIKKDNPANYGNCEVLVYFKSKIESPVYAWDLDTYHQFWLIEKCDSENLILYSPGTSDVMEEKNGIVYRFYTRDK